MQLYQLGAIVWKIKDWKMDWQKLYWIEADEINID